MSEPLSSYEIEDVLSSIRRLVSEGRRPGAKAAAPSAAEPLLLTPALRVVTAEAPARPAPPVMMLVSSRPEPQPAPVEEAPAAAPVAQVTLPADLADDETEEWSDVAWQAHMAEETRAIADASAVAAAPFRHGAHPADALPGVDPALVAQVEAQIVDTITRGETLVAGPARLGLVDHALLQDMVRELIRDELRGPLGARITRNLRKMVRAEINRAISIRGSD